MHGQQSKQFRQRRNQTGIGVHASEILKPLVSASKDDHAQRLARLEFENEQRKDMNAAFLKLEEAKEGLERFIREGGQSWN